MNIYIYIYPHPRNPRKIPQEKYSDVVAREASLISNTGKYNLFAKRHEWARSGRGGERNYARRNSREECGYTGGAQRKARVILT